MRSSSFGLSAPSLSWSNSGNTTARDDRRDTMNASSRNMTWANESASSFVPPSGPGGAAERTNPGAFLMSSIACLSCASVTWPSPDMLTISRKCRSSLCDTPGQISEAREMSSWGRSTRSRSRSCLRKKSSRRMAGGPWRCSSRSEKRSRACPGGILGTFAASHASLAASARGAPAAAAFSSSFENRTPSARFLGAAVAASGGSLPPRGRGGMKVVTSGRAPGSGATGGGGFLKRAPGRVSASTTRARASPTFFATTGRV
mmetsp:Transcript_18314/g.59247  ORF Transcript_18314/g.59247 Transcript_18314/m.59247 type:complete len:260 (-) Transcript_18314:1762-2541(-)